MKARCCHGIHWQRHSPEEPACQTIVDEIGMARAMMAQANLPEGLKYKLCKECFDCTAYLSNLAVVTLNGPGMSFFGRQNHAMPST